MDAARRGVVATPATTDEDVKDAVPAVVYAPRRGRRRRCSRSAREATEVFAAEVVEAKRADETAAVARDAALVAIVPVGVVKGEKVAGDGDDETAAPPMFGGRIAKARPPLVLAD